MPHKCDVVAKGTVFLKPCVGSGFEPELLACVSGMRPKVEEIGRDYRREPARRRQSIHGGNALGTRHGGSRVATGRLMGGGRAERTEGPMREGAAQLVGRCVISLHSGKCISFTR